MQVQDKCRMRQTINDEEGENDSFFARDVRMQKVLKPLLSHNQICTTHPNLIAPDVVKQTRWSNESSVAQMATNRSWWWLYQPIFTSEFTPSGWFPKCLGFVSQVSGLKKIMMKSVLMTWLVQCPCTSSQSFSQGLHEMNPKSNVLSLWHRSSS